MLVIGSRGSQLALWQARWVQARLAGLGLESRIEIIRTTGDSVQNVPLSSVGGKGLFTKEIEDALLARQVDLAVHSLKDLPTMIPAGLQIAAIPEREDPRDVLVGRRLSELPPGARVGTSSLRRSAQLRLTRPDLQIESVRGNVDTRLRKLDEGQYESIVLAAAGLTRLGWSGRIAEALEPEVMCPAVGQGALAVETRIGDNTCAALDHAETRAAVTAERALLASLGGGCLTPIGAHARITGAKLHLMAIVLSVDGAQSVRDVAEGPVGEAESIGRELGEKLLQQGASRILAL
jgi:hydroxymethylbilane synthase